MLTCDAKATGGKRVRVSSARRTCREANGAGGGGPDDRERRPGVSGCACLCHWEQHVRCTCAVSASKKSGVDDSRGWRALIMWTLVMDGLTGDS